MKDDWILYPFSSTLNERAGQRYLKDRRDELARLDRRDRGARWWVPPEARFGKGETMAKHLAGFKWTVTAEWRDPELLRQGFGVEAQRERLCMVVRGEG